MISLPTKYACLVNNDDMIRVIAISDIIVFIVYVSAKLSLCCCKGNLFVCC